MTPEKEGELFATLGAIVAALARQDGKVDGLIRDMAEVKARLATLPQTPEFYELRGRVEEISRRLPTTLAYQAPAKATGAD